MYANTIFYREWHTIKKSFGQVQLWNIFYNIATVCYCGFVNTCLFTNKNIAPQSAVELKSDTYFHKLAIVLNDLYFCRSNCSKPFKKINEISVRLGEKSKSMHFL